MTDLTAAPIARSYSEGINIEKGTDLAYAVPLDS